MQLSKSMRWVLLWGWGAALIAHLLILSPTSFWQALADIHLLDEARTAAAGAILAFTPGIFLISWLIGRDPALTWGDRLLYGWAAGYGIWIWGVLFLSYLPGGISQIGILLAFDLLALLLCGLAVYRGGSTSFPSPPRSWEGAVPPPAWGREPTGRGGGEWVQPQEGRSRTSATSLWLVLGLVILIATAFFFRFANLSYSEFQGDEAKVMLYAVGVIQGQEEALFTYRKGPTEIVIPAGLLSLLGKIDEDDARTPFAFANVICLFAIFAFGWRLFGDGVSLGTGALAGWLAAMLLALDGYFIGYTRIVQYPSFIFLMGIFTVYPLARLIFQWRNETLEKESIGGYIFLAALFAATGSLTHYEGALVGLPVLYLCWLLWRRTVVRKPLFLSLLLALLMAVGLLLTFYLPFIRHPSFTATVERYTTDVVGDDAFVYNRLSLFAANGALYNTIYAFGLTVSAAVVSILLICWRSRWRYPLGVVMLLCLVTLLLWANQSDGAPVIYALVAVAGLLTLLPVLIPTATVAERLLWIWLGIPFLINAFFLKDPNTHFYVFYTPWMLICGYVLAWLWQQARQYLKPQPAYLLGASVLVLTLFVFGSYAYAFFVAAPGEIVRYWDEQNPLPNWLQWTHPQDDHALFGMPHYSGWHVVSQLYADGVLQGSYATNVRHWIPEWYIRNSVYCQVNPEVVVIERLERFEEQAELHAMMGGAYHLWGVIYVYGRPHIDIYRNTPTTRVAQLFVPQRGEEKSPVAVNFEIASTELIPPTIPLGYRFGDQIELVGYRLPVNEAKVEGMLPVVLVWRALRPLNHDYTLFLQLLGPDNHKVGQLDTRPNCNAGPTDDWEVGERLPGYYAVPLFPGESPGVYDLLIGLYDSQSQERLPLYSADGAALGDALTLAQITVKP